MVQGVRVIGTAGERNHEYLRSLGTEPVVHGDGLAERVPDLLPEGNDAAWTAWAVALSPSPRSC
ncbi:hypothetical protein [Streptomyces sp. Qhu-G9]|uniref:hypothetical protein n=1 Tax=Streptomyces sp. Qhu-G9 TaxID=3452799 RepID=UPI003AF9073C